MVLRMYRVDCSDNISNDNIKCRWEPVAWRAVPPDLCSRKGQIRFTSHHIFLFCYCFGLAVVCICWTVLCCTRACDMQGLECDVDMPQTTTTTTTTAQIESPRKSSSLKGSWAEAAAWAPSLGMEWNVYTQQCTFMLGVLPCLVKLDI